METHLAAEKVTVIATYPTRMDAEMAKCQLGTANIQALITADDAGGLHIDFQRAHGVKLSVLQRAAPQARRLLANARLLPDARTLDGAAALDAAGEREPYHSGKGRIGLGIGIVALGVYVWMGLGPAVGAGLLAMGGAIGLSGAAARGRRKESSASSASNELQ